MMASQGSREPWRRQLVRDLGKERALGSRHHGEGARGGRAQRGEARGPALPPGKGGIAGERRGPRASPGAVIGQGSVGPRRAVGLDIPTLAALPSHGPPCPKVLVPSSLLLKALSSPVWEDSVVLYGVILCVPVTWAVVPVLICPVSSRVWRALHRPGLCPARLRRRLEGGGLGGED